MRLTYFKDKSNQHRWRIRANNGEIVASSSEGFSTKHDMLTNVELTANLLAETYDQWHGDLHGGD